MKIVCVGVLMIAASVTAAEQKPVSFGDDLAFLSKRLDVVVLSDASGRAQVAVAPRYQGRVMTSTANGPGGLSYGWINREYIAAGKVNPHFQPIGGEDRFWMGPEGGQFSIFFSQGAAFDLKNWFTPVAFDADGYAVISRGRERVAFQKRFKLTNYSLAQFDVGLVREVRLVRSGDAWKQLGVEPQTDLRMVAYESDNRVTNLGQQPWRKETGLLSVWILGMYNSSPATTVVVPVKPGPLAALGPVVNDTYFGKVPADRLVVTDKTAFFRADADFRSKIGVSPQRCQPILGSYDAANNALTLVQYTRPEGATDYVNSEWKIQDNPYGGDGVNSYNDGPPAPGAAQLGRFYELETSSPAAALKPGDTLTHIHRTIHIQGPTNKLDAVARAALGVGLEEIKGAFKK